MYDKGVKKPVHCFVCLKKVVHVLAGASPGRSSLNWLSSSGWPFLQALRGCACERYTSGVSGRDLFPCS